MATGALQPMTRRNPAGVFEALVAGDPARPAAVDYRLRFTFPGDHIVELDDPYRYGRVLTDFDLHLLAEGTHHRAFDKLGAHRIRVGTTTGVHFAVWAPNADRVSVVGDFNGWDGRVHAMRHLMPNGIWEIFIPDLPDGEKYKFEIRTRAGALLKKSDPFGFSFEVPPQSAAVVHDITRYQWRDRDWMAARPARGGWLADPMSIYEVHLGSWARVPEEGDRFLTYREMAQRLVPYVKEMGFTHVELLPGDGASVLGIVGLSGARLLRPDQPVRAARRLQAVRRRVPRGGARRDSRLGARSFSEGRSRAGAVRRHGAVRARGSAARRAPGLGHADLQLRPERSPELSALERALLARGVSHRRSARGRGCVDVVPRLLAQGWRVDSEPLRRARKSRRDRLSAAVERAHARRASRIDHGGGGVDGVSRRQPAGASGRPWFHLQVEHGLDARHARVRAQGRDLSALGAQPGDVLRLVHAHGEFHPAVLARRGGAR